jgi:hypothetical protein
MRLFTYVALASMSGLIESSCGWCQVEFNNEAGRYAEGPLQQQVLRQPLESRPHKEPSFARSTNAYKVSCLPEVANFTNFAG